MSPAGELKHATQGLAQQIFRTAYLFLRNPQVSCEEISVWSNLPGQFLLLLYGTVASGFK